MVAGSAAVDSANSAVPLLRSAAFTSKNWAFLTRRYGNATYTERPNGPPNGRGILRAGSHTRRRCGQTIVRDPLPGHTAVRCDSALLRVGMDVHNNKEVGP